MVFPQQLEPKAKQEVLSHKNGFGVSMLHIFKMVGSNYNIFKVPKLKLSNYQFWKIKMNTTTVNDGCPITRKGK